MPQPPFILTLDIGTSSTRAMLFDSQARPAPSILAQRSNQLRTTPNGGSEFDPDQLFQNVVKVIDDLLEQCNPLVDNIGGVAADTFVGNIMGLDVGGHPITPIYTYADTRCANDAESLRNELEMATVHNRTGCRIHSAYLPARFRWLARTQPDLLERVAHWISFGEYLFWKFFGELRVSYSVASWSGLLNRHELTWDHEWLDYLELPEEKLSPLVDVDQPLSGLSPEWAVRWPMLKNVPWFPAIGDGAAANLGSGCTGPQRVALTVGTTGAMRVALNRPVDTVPDGLWLYRVNRTYSLLGGATSEGGNVFAWLRRTLQLPSNLEEQLSQLPPAGHGLSILPFVAGERAPGWHDDARAVINGLTLNTQPLHILRAGLEAVALRFALIYQNIAPYLPANHQIIASGGALLNSPTWMQIIADVLGRPLIASAEMEATSRGVTLLALESLGVAGERAAKLDATYSPNFQHHKIYQAALEEQLHLYHKIIIEA